MKKSGAIVELERLKQLAEDKQNDPMLIAVAIIEVLLTYGNDPQIRQAVDDIPF